MLVVGLVVTGTVPWVLWVRIDSMIAETLVVVVRDVIGVDSVSHSALMLLIRLRFIIPRIGQRLDSLITYVILNWDVPGEGIRLLVDVTLITWILIVVALREAWLRIQLVRILVCESICCA